MTHTSTQTSSLKVLLGLVGLLITLTGCATKMQVRRAQQELKTLVDHAPAIIEQNHVELIYCGNSADKQRIAQIIEQTQRAVDIWFEDAPRDDTSKLLIFSPDEPLGKQLVREMAASHHVAGSTEARTHTILVAGYVSQDAFWTTLRHELTHDAMLRHYASPDLLPPFWLTEGMATVFEIPAFADGKPALNLKRFEKLKTICQTDHLNMTPLITRTSNTRSTSSDYAQAWGMTYFLLRQHSAAMRDYLAAYQQMSPVESINHKVIFDRTIGQQLDLTDLSNLLKRWVELQVLKDYP